MDFIGNKKTLLIKCAVAALLVVGLVVPRLTAHHELDSAPNSNGRTNTSQSVNASPAAEPQPEPTITLVAVGDIMLSRNVEQKMVKHNDWRFPFLETYQVTTAGDVVFGNLETPLIEGPIVQTGQMVFRADPKAVAGLQYGGFTVLSLANNHMKNQGAAGIEKTVATLDSAHIAHVGAGLNDGAADKPAILTIKGKKIGFLAYLDSAFSPASYEATADRAGSPFMDETRLAADIKNLKKSADIIVVSMHAGTEYSAQPNAKQISFARAAIDDGAQLVIGHHPHVVEPTEQYHGGYILYSLGNFVFDQMWSEPTREGAIATVAFSGNSVIHVELTPIKIFDYAQPRILSKTEGAGILDRMSNFTL